MEPLTGEHSLCLQCRPLGSETRGIAKMIAQAAESQALHADILGAIGGWHKTGKAIGEDAFNSLALRIFEYQLRHNGPYGRYCNSLGFGSDALPARWQEIPPVPITAFKDATLTTFPSQTAELCFETSGTTLGRSGRHYMQSAALYRASLLAGFDRAMLSDEARLRFLNVLPSRQEKPRSSLSYMVETLSQERGDGFDRWYVRGQELRIDAFIEDLRTAIADEVAVCITGTAFSLLNLIETLDERNERFALPPRSRIMETGGFKGRTKEIAREEFYAFLSDQLGIDQHSIVAEYGMTELTSQYYDSIESRAEGARVKLGPPWLQWRVVDSAGRDARRGARGILVHLDLANAGSVLAIATDDLAFACGDGFVLCGRSSEADARGCSLEAEALWSNVR